MNLLCIDTSGPVCGIAVMKDGHILSEAHAINKLTHSVSMMPMVEEALSHSGLSLHEIDLFAAVKGPGSFTGVRLGVSAIKALAHAENKKCLGVDALEAMAMGCSLFSGIICPIQDARAGQVYGAAFEGMTMKRLMDDTPIKIEELCEKCKTLAGDQKLLFLGDGMPVNREKIKACLGEQAVFAPENSFYLHAGAAALLAHCHADEAADCFSLSPFYLRPPQAERQKNLRELGHE